MATASKEEIQQKECCSTTTTVCNTKVDTTTMSAMHVVHAVPSIMKPRSVSKRPCQVSRSEGANRSGEEEVCSRCTDAKQLSLTTALATTTRALTTAMFLGL
jgi:hypothetical protein